MLIKLWKILRRRLVSQGSALLVAIRDPQYADYSPYQVELTSPIDAWAPESFALGHDTSERVPAREAVTEQMQDKNLPVSDNKLSHPALNAVEEELLFYFRGIPSYVQPAATLAIKALHDMLREGSEPRVFKEIEETPEP